MATLQRPTNTATYTTSTIRNSATHNPSGLTMDVVRGSNANNNTTTSNGYTMDVVRPTATTTSNNLLTMDVVRPSLTSGYRASNTYNSGLYASGARTSTYTGEGRVVAVNRGEAVVKSTRQGRNSRVIGQVEVGSKVVAENYSENIIGERLNHLPERIVSMAPKIRASVKRTMQTTEEECLFVEKVVEKPVEVVVERQVPRTVYRDVAYEQIIERPIERIIEKQIIVEKVVEREIEKTVEVPIEKIVEIPIEEVVEQPVPVIVYKDIPVEKLVTKTVIENIDNVIYNERQIDVDAADLHLYPNAHVLPTEVITNTQQVYVPKPVFSRNMRNNIVENMVQKIVKVPKEQIVERVVTSTLNRPVFNTRQVENTVITPQEVVIEKPVEHIIEKPVYITNIIKRPVPVQKTVEEIKYINQEYETRIPVDIEIQVPSYGTKRIQKTVETEVIKTVEVPVYTDIIVPLDEVRSQPLRLVQEKPQAVEVVEFAEIEYLVHREKPVAQDEVIEVQVPRFTKQMNVTELERPVRITRVVEEPVAVETEVHVEVENRIERPVYEVIEEIKNVVVDREVIEYYDVIKENIIVVEREEDVEVAIKTREQKPVENYQTMEEKVAVDRNVVEPVQGREINEGAREIQDEVLASRIEENRANLGHLSQQNAQLKVELRNLEVSQSAAGTHEYNTLMRQLAELRAQRSELHSRISIMMKDTDRLVQTSYSKATVSSINYTTIAPQVWELRRKLEALLAENRTLVSRAKTESR